MKCTRCSDVIPNHSPFFHGVGARLYHIQCPPLSPREMAIDEAVRRAFAPYIRQALGEVLRNPDWSFGLDMVHEVRVEFGRVIAEGATARLGAA